MLRPALKIPGNIYESPRLVFGNVHCCVSKLSWCYIFRECHISSVCVLRYFHNLQFLTWTRTSRFATKVLPAMNRPGKPGMLDIVSITYSGISISGEVILFWRNGSQLWYLLYIDNPEKQVVNDRSVRMGQDSHMALCEARMFLKWNLFNTTLSVQFLQCSNAM